jgi:hypothetical protein
MLDSIEQIMEWQDHDLRYANALYEDVVYKTAYGYDAWSLIESTQKHLHGRVICGHCTCTNFALFSGFFGKPKQICNQHLSPTKQS